MQIILLIAGLVLLLAGSSWFTGAATVGIICLVLFALACIAQAAVVVFAAKATKSVRRDLRTNRW